jgi:hypothetical protein
MRKPQCHANGAVDRICELHGDETEKYVYPHEVEPIPEACVDGERLIRFLSLDVDPGAVGRGRRIRHDDVSEEEEDGCAGEG